MSGAMQFCSWHRIPIMVSEDLILRRTSPESVDPIACSIPGRYLSDNSIKRENNSSVTTTRNREVSRSDDSSRLLPSTLSRNDVALVGAYSLGTKKISVFETHKISAQTDKGGSVCEKTRRNILPGGAGFRAQKRSLSDLSEMI